MYSNFFALCVTGGIYVEASGGVRCCGGDCGVKVSCGVMSGHRVRDSQNIPVMAAIAVRKKVISIGHFSPCFRLQSLQIYFIF